MDSHSSEIRSSHHLKHKKSFTIISTRAIVLAIACLHVIVTSGFSYGWNALLLILIGENKYSFLCTNFQDGQSCADEHVYLTRMFTIAYSLQYALGFPCGLINDFFGPRCAIYGHLTIMASLVGLAYFEPTHNMIFDWNHLFLSLMFVSRYFISTRYFHLANLFPDHFNLAHTLISTSTIISGGIFPLMYIFWEYAHFSLKSILTAFIFLLSPFIIFSLMQPKVPFKYGQKVHFSRKSFHFEYLDLPVNNTHSNLESDAIITLIKPIITSEHTKGPSNVTPEFSSEKKDTEQISPQLHDITRAHSSYTDNQFKSHNSFELEVPVKKSEPFDYLNFFKPYGKAFYMKINLIFYKLFLPSLLFSIWFLFFSVFLHSVYFILNEKSGDEDKSTLFTFIFSCIIPFGFIGSLIVAFLGDLIGTKTMIIGYVSIGLVHLLSTFLPFGYVIIISFVSYTISEDLLFASHISLISQKASEKIFCSILGLFYTYLGIFIYLAGRISIYLIEKIILWQTLYAIFTFIGFITLLLTFKLQSYKVSDSKNFSSGMATLHIVYQKLYTSHTPKCVDHLRVAHLLETKH